ncbi:MAG: filamentous hemagglutinin N-terminal domain-containing protein, partial [Cyanobacteria bacterium J06632_3]
MARDRFFKAVKTVSVSFMSAVGIVVGGLSGDAIAQNSAIKPDNTTNSVAEAIDANTDRISGGVIINTHLFHSFEDFNVAEGNRAYFLTVPNNIEDIFSRVTGDNASEIYGTLGTTGNSTPDLWLINPNGILFGPNARLEIAGSFIATTANRLQTEDGIPFAAVADAPENDDFLTISDSALFFNAVSDAKIINQSQATAVPPSIALGERQAFSGLQVNTGRGIAFAAEEVSLEGGGLNANNGSILLYGLDDVNLSRGSIVQAGNIVIDAERLSLTEGAQVLTQFVDPRLPGSSFSIINSDSGQIFSFQPNEIPQELPTAFGGNISVLAEESVRISGTTADGQRSSRIGSAAFGLLRNGANLVIQTDNLMADGGGQITSDYVSLSEQNEGGGNISVEASAIALSGSSEIDTDPNTPEIELRQSGLFVGSGFPPATDGSVFLLSDSLGLLNGAQIRSELTPVIVSENAEIVPGNVSIISQNVLIEGASENGVASSISAFSEAENNLLLSTRRLALGGETSLNGASIGIDSSEILFQESAGINLDSSSVSDNPQVNIFTERIAFKDNAFIDSTINLSATESIVIEDSSRVAVIQNQNQSASLPNVAIRDEAVVGAASLDGASIVVSDRAIIGSATLRGNSVNIADNVSLDLLSAVGDAITLQDNVQVNGGTNLAANETTIRNDVRLIGSSSFSGGDITIRDEVLVSGNEIAFNADNITLRDNAQVAADGVVGDSGQINILANVLNVIDSARLSASVEFAGNGGVINIVARESVNLFGDPESAAPSTISSTTGGPGAGGRISIETGQLSVLGGSQLTANLGGGGSGGTISILADSIEVSGAADSGQVSRISAESDLSGGEYGVLRSIRQNSQSEENVFIDQGPTALSLFVGGEVDALRFTQSRTGEFSSPNDFPAIRASVIDSLKEEGFLETGQPISIIYSITSTNLPTQLLVRSINPDEDGVAFLPAGLFLFGQSFETDFEESIEGGRRIASTENAYNEARALFASSFQELEDGLIRADERFSGMVDEDTLTTIESSNALADAFQRNAGNFYAVEATGDEFNIRDDFFTDTTFVDIAPGDLFLVFAVRDGGNIDIETGELIVREGAEISTAFLGSAEGNSAASNLNIEADSVLIENNARLSS